MDSTTKHDRFTVAEQFARVVRPLLTKKGETTISFDQTTIKKGFRSQVRNIATEIELDRAVDHFTVTVIKATEGVLFRDHLTDPISGDGSVVVSILVNVGPTTIFNKTDLVQSTVGRRGKKRPTVDRRSSNHADAMDVREAADTLPIGVINKEGTTKGKTVEEAMRTITGNTSAKIHWVPGRKTDRFVLPTNTALVIPPANEDKRYQIAAIASKDLNHCVVMIDFRIQWSPDALFRTRQGVPKELTHRIKGLQPVDSDTEIPLTESEVPSLRQLRDFL